MTTTAVAIETISGDTDLRTVTALARRIWHEHYPGLISRAQIDYMLAHGYTLPAMRAEIADGIHYVLARVDGLPVGFAAHGPEDGAMWLHKLYVLAEYRGRGIATALLDTAIAHAAEHRLGTLRLRVNKGNRSAFAAYQRWGFAIENEDVKVIGKGFMMDDYVLYRHLPDQPGVSVNG